MTHFRDFTALALAAALWSLPAGAQPTRPAPTYEDAARASPTELRDMLVGALLRDRVIVGTFVGAALPSPIRQASVTLRDKPRDAGLAGICTVEDLFIQSYEADVIGVGDDRAQLGPTSVQLSRGYRIADLAALTNDPLAQNKVDCGAIDRKVAFFSVSDFLGAGNDAQVVGQAARLLKAARDESARPLFMDDAAVGAIRQDGWTAFRTLDPTRISEITRVGCDPDAERMVGVADCVQFEIEIPGATDPGGQSGRIHRILLIARGGKQGAEPVLVRTVYSLTTWVV
jgi:hypothetical protein